MKTAPKQNVEPGWSVFFFFPATEMETSREKGIKLLAFHYAAVSK